MPLFRAMNQKRLNPWFILIGMIVGIFVAFYDGIEITIESREIGGLISPSSVSNDENFETSQRDEESSSIFNPKPQEDHSVRVNKTILKAKLDTE